MKSLDTPMLKRVTSVFLVLGFGLMIAGPILIGKPDRRHPRAYIRRVGWLGAGLAVAAIGAGAGAFLIMRRERERYREMALANMRELVEGTRQDQIKRATEESKDDE